MPPKKATPKADPQHKHPHKHEDVAPHEHDLRREFPGAFKHEHETPPHSHQEVTFHEHAEKPHEHPPHEHPAEVVDHGHPHSHEPHDHGLVPHDHRDQRALSIGAVRKLLAVLEAGSLNSEQAKAIHAVRVTIGDAHGTDCPHENTAYEKGDVLTCTDCGEKGLDPAVVIGGGNAE